jgi:transcription initiation factor TFIID subunit 9B
MEPMAEDTQQGTSNELAPTASNATNSDIPSDPALKPRDARLLHLLLTSAQVPAYSAKVPIQLLDFAYRYIHSILLDAQAYGDHVNGQGAVIGVEDVRVAVASRVGHTFRGPPPKEFLLEVAAERNRRPLPPAREGVEIRLPPERWCLNAPNWDNLVCPVIWIMLTLGLERQLNIARCWKTCIILGNGTTKQAWMTFDIERAEKISINSRSIRCRTQTN